MTTVSSREDVASQARLLLAVPAINSFDEDDTGIAELTYDRIVEALISGPYKWRFVTTKIKLVRSTEDPIGEWKYSYILPPDRKTQPRAVFKSDSQNAPPTPWFEIFGQRLYSNDEDVWIDYGVYPSEGDWPAYFAQLVIYACAAEWAETLTEDEDKALTWRRIAFGAPEEGGQGGYFKTAKTADAQGGGIQAHQNFELITARLGSG